MKRLRETMQLLRSVKMRTWAIDFTERDIESVITCELQEAMRTHAPQTTEHQQRSIDRHVIKAVRTFRRKRTSLWTSGRASASWYDARNDAKLYGVTCEWHICRPSSIGVTLEHNGSEGEMIYALRVPWFLQLYVCFPSPLSTHEDRELGVLFHDGTLWLRLWNDTNGYKSRAPFTDAQSSLRQPSIDVAALVLGRPLQSTTVEETVDRMLYLDEGYRIRAERKIWRLRRSRLWWYKETSRVTIYIPDGIPIPDDGDNDYDTGDDKIFEFSTVARTIEEACQQLIQSILKQRSTT